MARPPKSRKSHLFKKDLNIAGVTAKLSPVAHRFYLAWVNTVSQFSALDFGWLTSEPNLHRRPTKDLAPAFCNVFFVTPVEPPVVPPPPPRVLPPLTPPEPEDGTHFYDFKYTLLLLLPCFHCCSSCCLASLAGLFLAPNLSILSYCCIVITVMADVFGGCRESRPIKIGYVVRPLVPPLVRASCYIVCKLRLIDNLLGSFRTSQASSTIPTNGSIGHNRSKSCVPLTKHTATNSARFNAPLLYPRHTPPKSNFKI